MKRISDIILKIEDYKEITLHILEATFYYELSLIHKKHIKPVWFNEELHENDLFINYCNYLHIFKKNGKFYYHKTLTH